MPARNDGKRFLSVISYFCKRQDDQYCQEKGYPAVVSKSADELSLCVLHAVWSMFVELLSITSKPEADRGKLEIFVPEPGAICSVVKFTINLFEE